MEFLADQVLCFYICQKESKATGSNFYVNHKNKKTRVLFRISKNLESGMKTWNQRKGVTELLLRFDHKNNIVMKKINFNKNQNMFQVYIDSVNKKDLMEIMS